MGGGACHPYPTKHGSCAENTVKRLPPSIRMALMNLRREKQSFRVDFKTLILQQEPRKQAVVWLVSLLRLLNDSVASHELPF